MTRRPVVVIVGASVAGVRTAQALRSYGFEGRIRLVSDEEDLPYDKPPLSKGFLSGAKDLNAIQLFADGQVEALDVELELGVAATRLHPGDSLLELADGRNLEFDQLVVATGAHARPSPWGLMDRVHVLRTCADSTALREGLRSARHLVVVGAGFIGSEVAATARSLGVAVTMIDPLSQPLARILGVEVGDRFIGLQKGNGVAAHFGVGVEGLDVVEDGITVRLTDGSTIAADLVVVGIGSVPNDNWLDGSGLVIDDGVLCDEFGRTPDARHVFAVGDVSRWYDPRHRVARRLEHWTNAVDQANCVATAIARPSEATPHIPNDFVWSDQHDWKIQVAGRPSLASQHHLIDTESSPARFSAVYGDDDGHLVGGVAVNWTKALLVVRRGLAGNLTFQQACESIEALKPPSPVSSG